MLLALPLLEEEARKRQLSTLKQGTEVPVRELIPQREKGKASEHAAKQFQTNSKYIEKIKQLNESGKQDIVNGILKQTITLSEIKKVERTEKINKQKEKLEKNVLEKPDGLFDIIVIDPPWPYGSEESYDSDGFRGTTPYPEMSLEEIKQIKLPTKEDCVLWLWTTNTFLHDSFHLLNDWGFELKSMLTWDKVHFGTGRWLRSQTEHCLLAIKGKPYFQNTKWSTLISEKRTTHSTKPEIFYQLVNETCAGRKLDYFARKKREGWICYGDELK
jgi:N6-adenosine-specific RNA methylase IME4